MKYCKECKVYLNEKLSHCPLCGSHPENAPEGGEFYLNDIQPAVSYPPLKLRGDAYHNFLRKKSLLIIFVCVIICVFVNIFATPESLWSAYVTVSGAVVFFCILESLYRHRRFYSQLTLFAFILPVAALLYDLIHALNSGHDFSYIGISISYVCPTILLGLHITCMIMAFADKRENKYYSTSTLLISILAAWPQIIVWITGNHFVSWLTFAVFSYAMLSAAIVSILNWKKIQDEFRRKFYL